MKIRALQGLPRDKADTLLLLGSALLVLAPHAAHLPLWVTLLCAATLAWRAAVTLRGKRMPSTLVLLPIAAAAMAGVQFSYNSLLGRDAGVAMLVLLVAFKMLEMHARRDLYVVIFLCFFLVLTNFFYAQGIGSALLMVVAVLALLTTQLSFQFTGKVPPLRARLKMGLTMLAFAAPLAVALFLVFPRLGGPLWSMAGSGGGGSGARSGLSERMAPGQMSNLAMSDEPAFRVRFAGPVPPKAQLYWRGLVLDAFDGTAWTRGGSIPGRANVSLRVRGAALRYEVTLEPSDTRWLFTLEMPGQLPQVRGYRSRASHQLELTSDRPLAQRVRYALTSYPDYTLDGDEALEDPNQWLLLPYGYNPRALAAGLALRKEPPGRRIDIVLRQFREQPYSYTLEPPLLGRHSVDEFLYGTRAGFCEHYSGAFVFLMRAAGIPARVVTGYQGGEVNPIDGFVTVRQSDAHAWAEVWLRGRGWVRVDPTAAVAPERVRRNLASAVQPPPPFGIDALRGFGLFESSGDTLFGRLRNAAGAVNNGWNQWVLNYTPERQRGVLQNLQSAMAGWRFAALTMFAVAVLLLARILYRRRETDPVEAVYSSLCKRLAQLGLARAADEGPTAWAARIADARQLAPPSRDAAAEFLRRYSAWRYAPPQGLPSRQLAATLKSLLSQVR